MRYRLLTLGWAYAAVLAMAAPAAAQIAVPRHPGSQSGWYGNRGNEAYQNGFREGQREGESDGRSGKDYGYKRDDRYEDADRGYRGGGGYSKDAYRRDFRAGYEAGYDVGYRRFGYHGGGYGDGRYGDGRYGGYGRYPDNRNPGGYYPGSGGYGSRIAFDNGYSDGQRAGIEDGRRNRSFDPGRHRSTRGYDRRYGGRDSYEREYRSGFRSGYEEGFRSARRYDRRW